MQGGGGRKLINSSDNLNKYNNTIILLPFCIILLNIQLFDVGAAVKPAHIIVILIILSAIYNNFKINKPKILLIYIFVPLLGLSNIISLYEFIKTYVVYILSSILIMVGLQYYKNIDKAILKKMFTVFFRAFNITAAYGIVQFLSANIFKNLSLYNNLGSFQFHPHLDNSLFGLYRATSIYIEPSVFAWVCTTVFVILYYLRNCEILKKEEYIFTGAMCVSGIAAAISSSGFLGSIAIGISIIFTKKRNKINSALLISILAFSIIVLIFKPSLLRFLRLEEIMRENTSGYKRLVEPLFAMAETMKMYPLAGRGLGQIGVQNSDLIYNIGIHNSFYGIFITFGMSAFIYIIPIAYKIYSYIKNDKTALPLFVNILYVFSATGSFLSLEIPVIYCLCVLAISYKNNYDFKGASNPLT